MIEIIVPVAALAMFAGIWCVVFLILSIVSGWGRLATAFAHRGRFEGLRLRFQSARVKYVAFNNALTIGASEHGLYLSPTLPFQLFHKPLLIPWSEIDAEPFKRLWLTGYRLSLRSFPDIKLELGERTFEKILAHLRGQAQPPVTSELVRH